MRWGFGIVGCGMIAKVHARAIAEIPSARLITCFSHNLPRAKSFAAEHQCGASSSLKDLVADPRVQMVCICTPSGAHAEPALAAIRHGKHVLVEKPLEVTLPRCDRILHAAESAGVLVTTIFQSRFHPAAQAVHQAIGQERFGRIMLADAYVKWYRPQAYYDRNAWRGTWKLDGGGALMNQAIHSVDLLLWMMGPVTHVTAQADTRGHERIEVEDVLVATLRFANGALGVIEATTASYPGSLKKIEIRGTQGTAVLEEQHILEWSFHKSRRRDAALLARLSRPTQSGGGAADPAAIDYAGHAAQFRDFVAAIRKGRTPMVDGPQARAAVELVLAIYAAAKSGRTQSLR